MTPAETSLIETLRLVRADNAAVEVAYQAMIRVGREAWDAGVRRCVTSRLLPNGRRLAFELFDFKEGAQAVVVGGTDDSADECGDRCDVAHKACLSAFANKRDAERLFAYLSSATTTTTATPDATPTPSANATPGDTNDSTGS